MYVVSTDAYHRYQTVALLNLALCAHPNIRTRVISHCMEVCSLDIQAIVTAKDGRKKKAIM